MKFIPTVAAALLAPCYLVSTGFSAVLLDDTWADGTRSNQSLPGESAWFSSTGSALTAAPGAMTLSIGSGAVLALTYFTTNDTSPASLAVGDTLVATIQFTFNGVPAQNTSQGFRIAICDFADSTLSPKRAAADGFSNSSQGAGVQGYALFQNCGATFSGSSPMDLRKRTGLTTASLLGSSTAWTSMGTGPGSLGSFSGFASGSDYTLQLSLQRSASNTLVFMATWRSSSSGATLTSTFTDTAATNFNFDGIALRPQDNASAPSGIVFREVTVEWIPGSTPPSITSQPQDVAVYTGQPAAFSVLAGGTPPLTYQWYFNTNTPLEGETNASLTLSSAQLTNAGSYSVSITNGSGSAASDFAVLTVTDPVAPSVLAQPQDLYLPPGSAATFTVVAGGSEPLAYQWYFNETNSLAGATGATLVRTNIQAGDAGSYSVVINNLAGTITSSNAVLALNTNPVAPQFVTQPASQVVLAGTAVSFAATASGTAPIAYQWLLNGAPLAGATNATLSLSNVQTSDSGSYSLSASNSVGGDVSQPAQLTVTPVVPIVNSAYDITGFGVATTGGGVLPDTDPNYAKVYTATDLANALSSKTVKIIEIMNDLNLGYNEIEASAKVNSEPFRAHTTPLLHPVLLQTGVSLIDIQKKNGLTIFSANGATIRHATFNVKGSGNVIIRNLKFDQMWEWDESSKGNYDRNDWDFVDLGNSGTVSNIWVDHCTFTKAYDGISDIKGGSYNITFSWCKYTGDDGMTNSNSWVRQQISALESNRTSYAMYNFLRNNGFSVEDIVTICQGHDKTHLIGANSLTSENAAFKVTFHHDWFINPWDRLPRLRAGNVHNYNIYVDDTLGIAAKRLRDARAAAMSTQNRSTLNNTYSFNPFLNGSISTEGGAVLVEKSVYIDCLTPLRNNQTDPSNPTYTGKILALDTIYQMDSTVVRGNSTDPGNPLGPFQAPIIPFSWNLPGNQLPYSYTMDDPSQLASIVTSPTGGAGAGVLTWAKTNWLITHYAKTAPVIVADPVSRSVNPGDSAVFVVVSGGSAPLSYQWYFNTNTPVSGATNATLSLSNIQSTNAGVYTVLVSNAAGSAPSGPAVLTVSGGLTGFGAWQASQFNAAQLADPNVSGPDATPAGDGVQNFVKYALGLTALSPAVQPLAGYRVDGGDLVLSYNRPASAPDVTYVVEVSTDNVQWSTNGVTLQQAGMNGALQVWEGRYPGWSSPSRSLRLRLLR
ncbi:MAG: immunoglobulin domain-containing protein [Verrucomicrobiota bacterium]